MPVTTAPAPLGVFDDDDDDGWQDMPVVREDELKGGLDEEDQKRYHYVPSAKGTNAANAIGTIDVDDLGNEWRSKIDHNENEYTRLRVREEDENDDVHLRTRYLFDEDKAMTPLSQMQGDKESAHGSPTYSVRRPLLADEPGKRFRDFVCFRSTISPPFFVGSLAESIIIEINTLLPATQGPQPQYETRSFEGIVGTGGDTQGSGTQYAVLIFHRLQPSNVWIQVPCYVQRWTKIHRRDMHQLFQITCRHDQRYPPVLQWLLRRATVTTDNSRTFPIYTSTRGLLLRFYRPSTFSTSNWREKLPISESVLGEYRKRRWI